MIKSQFLGNEPIAVVEKDDILRIKRIETNPFGLKIKSVKSFIGG
jgi:hypothetical protein